jgi:hypothetical protein
MKSNDVLTRRQYLTYRLLMRGFPAFVVLEAVASTAIEHPEWDMDEEKTWLEWTNN